MPPTLSIKQQADALADLATECNVAMTVACPRAGIAFSTYYRWRGSVPSMPRDGAVEKLRAAILLQSQDQGHLPDKYLEEAERARTAEQDALTRKGELQQILGRLKDVASDLEKIIS